jgi:hypothetical protein
MASVVRLEPLLPCCRCQARPQSWRARASRPRYGASMPAEATELVASIKRDLVMMKWMIAILYPLLLAVLLRLFLR